jgi:cell division transport system permease protein
MKTLKLKRVIREGWISFRRNTWLTVATVGVLALSLFVIGNTLFVGMSANEIIENIEKNVNISIYFKNSVTEEEIMQIKSDLEKRPELASVAYISKESALEKFSKDNESNEVISEALDEIGENPLFSSLVLTASNQASYEPLVKYVENNFQEEIDRINYGKNKMVIEKLGRSTAMMQKIGLSFGLIFILIAVLVTFSAIRMSLYTRKREFDIMRLVGASNLYIRIPSIVEGIMYGLTASIIAIIFIAITTYGGIPMAQGVMPKEQMMSFYFESIWKIGLIVVFAGVTIGVVSSFISIRKYLKI